MFSSNLFKGLAVLCIGLLVATALFALPASTPPSGQTIVNPDGSVTIIDDTETLNMGYGEQLLWEPTFSLSNYAMTVAGSTAAMPSQSATFSATSCGDDDTVKVEIVRNEKLRITVSDSYSPQAKYYVMVKASVDSPPQTLYHGIEISMETYSMSYNTGPVYARVGSTNISLTPAVTGPTAPSSYTISGGNLPAGVSFDGSTGKITGIPSAYKGLTTYTITAHFTGSESTMTATVKIGAFTDLSATDLVAYAIVDDSDHRLAIPDITKPTGTTIEKMTLKVTKNGTTATVTAGTAYKGMTVTATKGGISGTPTEAGTYVFTETFKATDATGGSTATRTVTVVVENRVSGFQDKELFITENSRFVQDLLAGTSYTTSKITASIARISAGGVGNYIYKADYATLTNLTTDTEILQKYAEIGQNVHNPYHGQAMYYNSSLRDYEQKAVTLDASNLPDSSDKGFAIGLGTQFKDHMILRTCPAGDYGILVRMASANATVPSAGVGGTDPSMNFQYMVVNVHVHPTAAFSGADATFYMATNRAYTPLTLESNLDNGVFTVTSYPSGISASNINVAQNGVVKSGATAMATPGTYDLTVKVQDPNISTNNATGTLHVVVSDALAITEVKITNRTWF